MKIVHILPSLVKGGAERAVVDLANWQVENGHEVTIVAGTVVEERLMRVELDHRVGVKYVSRSAGRVARYMTGLMWFRQNRRWLEQQDAVHAHLTFSAVLLTAVYGWRRMARREKPLLIETYHAVGMPIRRITRWIHAMMAKRRDWFVLMADDPYWSKFAATHLRGRWAQIQNGLADPGCPERHEPAVQDYRRAAGIPDTCQLVIGTVGRLVGERRPELIAQVMASLAQVLDDNVHFLMVGSGQRRAALERFIQESRLQGRLHLPGVAVDPRLPIALMDVYLTINIGATTGLAGVQAAYCGVPLVGIQLANDYRQSDGDWIWSSGDLTAVTREVLRLVRDPQERSVQAARQRAYALENLSIDQMGRSYDRLYSSTLQVAQVATNGSEPCAQ